MIRETLSNAQKDAMKAKDTARLSTVRLILAAIKDKDIANRGLGKEQASEDEILQLLAKMIKQREESVKIYIDGGRPELADKEREEIAVIQGFMPEQLSKKGARDLRCRRRRTRRAEPEGYGQVCGRPARALCRPDGFRKSLGHP